MNPAIKKLWNSRLRTIPNAISLSRFVAAPIAFWCIIEGRFFSAAFIIAAAGVSDWLDGHVARKMNDTSLMGRLLDPLADKVFVDMVLFALWVQGMLSWATIALVVTVGYDLYVTYIRWGDFEKALYSSEEEAKLTPSPLGKIKTALQFGAIFVFLGSAAFPGFEDMNNVGESALAVTVALILINGVHYTSKSKKTELAKVT